VDIECRFKFRPLVLKLGAGDAVRFEFQDFDVPLLGVFMPRYKKRRFSRVVFQSCAA
jgi:hypothetical protein